MQKAGPPVPRPGEFAPDLAWPLYTLRQSAIDKKAVRGNLYAYQKRLWKWPVNTFFRRGTGSTAGPWWFPLTPVPITVLFFLGGAFLVSWASYWVYWGTLTAFWWVDKTVIMALRGQLRVREARRRETMHIAAACMKCLHVTPWPAYACRACGEQHHDVMPGDLGTFYRKCAVRRQVPDPAVPRGLAHGGRLQAPRVPAGAAGRRGRGARYPGARLRRRGGGQVTVPVRLTE